MSIVADSLPLPDLYYNPPSRVYYREDNQNRWMQVDSNTAKNFIIQAGYSSEAQKGTLSEAAQCQLKVQAAQNVAYAAPLAGYQAGFYTINNERILVTDSPCLIEPVPGEWPLLGQILTGMFVDGDIDQRPYLYGWLKNGITAVRTGCWAAGQVLAIAGPVRGGKSLLQTLITDMLGGRCAFPYQHMTGETTFNAELFGSEHLVVDDQAESTDFRARKQFASNIKQVAVTKTHRCHQKGVTAITLTPRWRMTISLNDEPERILVLPPLDDDVADKLMLLKANSHSMPMPTETAEEQEVFYHVLSAELPAFIDFLLGYQIPECLRAPRFGIQTYQHPDLVQRLNETAPEYQLMELISNAQRCGAFDGHWTGSANQLLAELTSDICPGRVQTRELLKNPKMCGVYLGRVADRPDSGITSRLLHGTRIYTIDASLMGGRVEDVTDSLLQKEKNIKDPLEKESIVLQGSETDPPFHPSKLATPGNPITPPAVDGAQSNNGEPMLVEVARLAPSRSIPKATIPVNSQARFTHKATDPVNN